jgi:hypothetical protein
VAHYGYGWGLEGGSGRYGWTAVVQLGSIRREIQTSPAGDAGRTLFVWDSPSDLGRLGHVVPQKIPLGFGPPSVAAPAPAELVIPHQGRL